MNYTCTTYALSVMVLSIGTRTRVRTFFLTYNFPHETVTISDFKIIIKKENMKWRLSQFRLCVMGSWRICHRSFVNLMSLLCSSVGSVSASYASGPKIDTCVQNILACMLTSSADSRRTSCQLLANLKMGIKYQFNATRGLPRNNVVK